LTSRNAVSSFQAYGLEGRREFMRQLGWALIGVASLMAVRLQTVEAGVTCKVLPNKCGAATDNHNNVVHADGVKPTEVPEPATLLLLGAGVSAVGAAAMRRRKQK
jgi:hypothetical protein